VPDVHRLRDQVRWRPRFTLNEGLERTIEWWRHHLPGAASGA
jgi:nucleoside-diphosphate-sugar epimerase